MNLHFTFKWLRVWVVLLVMSTLASEGVHFATPGVESGAMQVTLALCCSWLAVLLTPVNSDRRKHLGATVLWAITAATGFLILSFSPFYFEQGNRGLQVAGGVLILVLLFSAIQSLLQLYSSNLASAKILLTLITGVFLAAPLYLSVVAEATSHQILVDTIIAASPVSYLAAIADYDYLRSNWFYQHTPFGGLRFNYPSPGVMTFCYIVITLVLTGATFLGNRSQLRTLKK